MSVCTPVVGAGDWVAGWPTWCERTPGCTGRTDGDLAAVRLPCGRHAGSACQIPTGRDLAREFGASPPPSTLVLATSERRSRPILGLRPVPRESAERRARGSPDSLRIGIRPIA